MIVSFGMNCQPAWQVDKRAAGEHDVSVHYLPLRLRICGRVEDAETCTLSRAPRAVQRAATSRISSSKIMPITF